VHTRHPPGLLPSLILVVNPAVQYALFEWGMQRAAATKARRAARRSHLRGGPLVVRGPAKLGPGEVFLIGERVLALPQALAGCSGPSRAQGRSVIQETQD
jgi:hypothetical protein